MDSTTPLALNALPGALPFDCVQQEAIVQLQLKCVPSIKIRYYAPQAMDDSCLSCDAGKTAASEGATGCDACAAGSYAPNKAKISI